jgi:TPR repeat protein
VRPQVERVRLSAKTPPASRRSKEQEVLHYRWFADLGNSDAARALGQMLSHGPLRDPEQALRYFRREF